MFRFIIESHSFRRIGFLTFAFVALFYFTSNIFDYYWESTSSVPLVNLNVVYAPPKEYDNINKINLHLISDDLVVIEGNRRFRLIYEGNPKNYDYFDSIVIVRPDTSFSNLNKIFMKFENNTGPDSVYLVVSNSEVNDYFYNQIFYSSVIVNSLNELSDDPEGFRINDLTLASSSLLISNDTLINNVFNYFNENAPYLSLAECGRNCNVFKIICAKFGVPCRMVWLQGGDIEETGYGTSLGYPLHVVCEIYSSSQNKWYVADPSYGIRFKNIDNNSYMSAVELSILHSFGSDDAIEQDSILVVKKNIVGRDYFKFYENVLFGSNMIENVVVKKFLTIAYSKFNYRSILYSNNYPEKKDGNYYFGMKTFLYLVILIFYINSVLFLIAKRLFSVKKP